jgi:hypothetical protein
VRLAKKHGVKLRQSYARVGKFALIKHQRYAHAKQFKRANRALKTLRTYLGRIIRDIARKIENDGWLKEVVFKGILSLARRVRDQKQHQRGPKVYSLHAPEVECIGKGKVHRPYEFGVKVSVATTHRHSKGGQFVTHAKALPGNPYDGHTLATVIPDMEALVGNTIQRAFTDKGYRGHNAPPDYKFRVFIAGQKRRVTPKIKRQMRRRSAVEPVIGHLKSEHRMGRNYLWYRQQLNQRRPRRRRIQLPPPHPLAEALVVPFPGRGLQPAPRLQRLKSEIFTDDHWGPSLSRKSMSAPFCPVSGVIARPGRGVYYDLQHVTSVTSLPSRKTSHTTTGWDQSYEVTKASPPDWLLPLLAVKGGSGG